MKQYLDSLQYILDHGQVREDRTGVGTIGVFGMQQRYDLSKGFPAVTTKKLAFKACLSELLWFIEGSGDEKRLREILHGSRDSDQSTIWTANATAPYWVARSREVNPKPPGYSYIVEGELTDVDITVDQPNYDLGRIYGVQWRSWRKPIQGTFYNEYVNGTEGFKSVPKSEYHVDQIAELIQGIKRDPSSRRHIITAWNPGELEQMALPPCHCFAQFYVTSDGKLSCQMYQRSCDMFLGVPFNIASYALFTHMIAQVCELGVGELVHVLGDAHIYLNHIEQVKEQIQREPLPAPTLWINPKVTDIEKFTMDDFRLDNYNPMPSIKAPMAV